MLRSVLIVIVVMVTMDGWDGRWRVHGSDEGIRSHVPYAWGRRCTYCNDCRRNALTNKLFLTLFLIYFSLMGQLQNKAVADGLSNNGRTVAVSRVATQVLLSSLTVLAGRHARCLE